MVLTAITLTYWEQLKKKWKELLCAGILFISQIMIYGRQAMSERYLIPIVFSFAYLFVLVLLEWKPLSGKRRVIYIITLIGLLVVSVRTTLIEADYYRYRGESVTRMLDVSLAAAADKDANVMSCLGYSNPEADMTIDNWMKLYGEGEHIWYWDFNKDEVTDRRPFLNTDDYQSIGLNEIDLIVAYGRTDRHFTGIPSVLEDEAAMSQFTKIRQGSINLYVRNGSDIEIIGNPIKDAFYDKEQDS